MRRPFALSVPGGGGVASEATCVSSGTLSGCRRRLLRGRGGRGLRRVDAYELAVTPLVLELHDAVDEREQGVVLAPPAVFPRLPLLPARSREVVAAEPARAPELLKAEPLRVRVAPVSR